MKAFTTARRCVGGALGIRTVNCNASFPHAVVYHEDFTINPLPPGHRFPMPKDALLYAKLKDQGLATRTFTPTVPDLETICLVHDEAYVQKFLHGTLSPQMEKALGLPWSEGLVRRTLIGVGSAILAARLAVEFGVAVMCNGGTHHAHRDRGSGWCVFNDQAIGARAVQRDVDGIEKVLFVDLDVHQGDGTATIFDGDASVFTLSIHCKNQPFPQQVQKSDCDVPLPAGCLDVEYMAALESVLPRILDDFRPDLVMYNAGVDVHENDALGLLALTFDGILQRDRYVFDACATRHIPVAAAIGGGYEQEHGKLVDKHLLLHIAAAENAERFLACGRSFRSASRMPLSLS